MHLTQIKTLHQGSHQHLEYITNILGYHYILAYLGFFIDDLQLWQARTLSLLLSLLNIIFIYKIAQHFFTENRHWLVLEVCLLPIAFPYLFMVYTDLPSLLFVLGAFYFTLKKQYILSAVFLLISVCIRQPNIIWGAFIAVYIFVEQYKARFTWPTLQRYLLSSWSFILLSLLFIAFLYWNGGVAMGDKAFHPLGRLRLTNIIFALYTFFIIFLPLHIHNLSKVRRLLQRMPGLIFLCIILYIIFYNNTIFDHPYNGKGFYLRNKVLIWVMANTFVKMIFVLIAVFTVLSLAVTPLKQPAMYWMYLFLAISLLPSWLVEQRYYIVGAAFFVLFKQENKELSIYQIGYSFMLSFVAWRGALQGDFFL